MPLPVADPDDWTPPELDEHAEIPGEQVLLDENVEADGHDFFSMGAATVSIDGNTLAYSVDVVGDERYTLKFKDLAPATCTTTRSPGSEPAPPGPPTTGPSTTSPSTTRGARTPCGGTGSAPAAGGEGLPRTRRAVLLAVGRSRATSTCSSRRAVR